MGHLRSFINTAWSSNMAANERPKNDPPQRNIHMANSARPTRSCSVASRAGAIPRIHAETWCEPNRCTKYSRVPDSHSAHSRADEEYKSEATEAWITQKRCSMSERSNRHSRQRFHTGKHDEQEGRYFLRYIHAPST